MPKWKLLQLQQVRPVTKTAEKKCVGRHLMWDAEFKYGGTENFRSPDDLVQPVTAVKGVF